MEQKVIASYSILCVELEELLDVIELGLDDGTPNKMAATLNVVEMALKGIISVHQENIKVMEKIDKEI
ncbi:hypothetical protein JavanS624_0004 [Streptococcus satellite phage Javan624]|uniref:hypothetical protein n=1 Tax=Streptococcus uberis TaxID=1349 RepID=UPI00062048EC|nr:hypothetical protein [Streptococcus uberis]KKF60425.1 hypothetical protein AF68_03485 [Streptococcus uberis B362]QBX11996.1 hypothetical protein JavanS624_0004 [Streptococcus satellite phage Javan624]